MDMPASWLKKWTRLGMLFTLVKRLILYLCIRGINARFGRGSSKTLFI